MKRLKEFLTTAVHLRTLVQILLTLAVLCGFARAAEQSDEQAHYLLLLAFIGVYLVFLFLTELLFRLVGKVSRKEMTEGARPALGSVNLDFISSLTDPVAVLDEGGRMVWYNTALAKLVGDTGKLYQSAFEEFAGVTVEEVKEAGEEGLSVRRFDRAFLLHAAEIKVRGRRSIAMRFEDVTALETALQEKKDETALIAYIIIDNLEELSKYAQNRARAAASEAQTLLEHWAAGFDGIFKEYEREKFLLLFDQKHLAAMVESRFGILDRIREIRVGDSGLPITVSMGISHAPGTPMQRAEASAKCLEMALQRGGDQVVLRGEDGTFDFYGGKTKTVQKRTRVRARMMALNLLARISESTDVLIMMHRFPDFDAIGAALGILRLSSFCGVKARIIVNPADPNFARCFARVRHLSDYRDETAFLPPALAQDQMTPGTLLVIVDVNNRAQFEVPEIADMIPGERTVVVDHHRKLSDLNEKPIIEYIEPSASSSCELITEMIEQTMQPGILQKEEADIMYAGISLDTKQFVRNTGVRTFSAALFLRGEGASPSDAQALFKTDLDDFVSEAVFENNVQLYRAVFALAIRTEVGGNGDRIAAAKAADKLLFVEGIAASFAICPLAEGVFISARSAGEVNVQLIMEALGGGGHFDASATMLKGATVEEAIVRLKEAIDGGIAA